MKRRPKPEDWEEEFDEDREEDLYDRMDRSLARAETASTLAIVFSLAAIVVNVLLLLR